MNYLIYKVTNTQTNQVYIGQTTKTLEQRKRSHYIEAKYKANNNKAQVKFHKALIIYPEEI